MPNLINNNINIYGYKNKLDKNFVPTEIQAENAWFIKNKDFPQEFNTGCIYFYLNENNLLEFVLKHEKIIDPSKIKHLQYTAINDKEILIKQTLLESEFNKKLYDAIRNTLLNPAKHSVSKNGIKIFLDKITEKFDIQIGLETTHFTKKMLKKEKPEKEKTPEKKEKALPYATTIRYAKFYHPDDLQLNKPIGEVCTAEFYRYLLGPDRVPKVRLIINEKKDIIGSYSTHIPEFQSFCDTKIIPSDRITKKPIVKDIPNDRLIKAGMGSLMAASYAMGENDLHANNYGFNSERQLSRIDFDQNYTAFFQEKEYQFNILNKNTATPELFTFIFSSKPNAKDMENIFTPSPTNSTYNNPHKYAIYFEKTNGSVKENPPADKEFGLNNMAEHIDFRIDKWKTFIKLALLSQDDIGKMIKPHIPDDTAFNKYLKFIDNRFSQLKTELFNSVDFILILSQNKNAILHQIKTENELYNLSFNYKERKRQILNDPKIVEERFEAIYQKALTNFIIQYDTELTNLSSTINLSDKENTLKILKAALDLLQQEKKPKEISIIAIMENIDTYLNKNGSDLELEAIYKEAAKILNKQLLDTLNDNSQTSVITDIKSWLVNLKIPLFFLENILYENTDTIINILRKNTNLIKKEEYQFIYILAIKANLLKALNLLADDPKYKLFEETFNQLKIDIKNIHYDKAPDKAIENICDHLMNFNEKNNSFINKLTQLIKDIVNGDNITVAINKFKSYPIIPFGQLKTKGELIKADIGFFKSVKDSKSYTNQTVTLRNGR
ncbi:MAG: hypothetical protein LEGION0398_MBIBDBAK_00022 [Legionellaceae bacterium]